MSYPDSGFPLTRKCLQVSSRRAFNSPAAGHSASRQQYKTMTTKNKSAAPKSAPLAAPSMAEAKATLAAAPAAPKAKRDIRNVTREELFAFGSAMDGGFVRFEAKRNKAGALSSVSLSVPRFRGESFAVFVGHFTGSLPEGTKLGKVELDFLRGIFAAADEAALAFGAEAARVSFRHGRTGLRIDATAYRA